MATWFVRANGGTTTQCTGKTNAAYPGSGTGQACAYSNLQDALTAATFGDTVKLHAGDTFTRNNGLFASFILANKGTPPTHTDADYITVTTDDPTGTPSALFGYPASGTRITTAMAANMPHVRIDASTPAFGFRAGAKYWKIERLDIANVDVGVQCIRLFGLGDGVAVNSLADVLDHITIQDNWIHPIEEVGAPLSASNLSRTCENAIFLDGTNMVIQNNAIQGFVGRVKYGGDAGVRMTSAGILITVYVDTMLIQNNLIEAWTYAFFSGGASMPDWTVTEGGTIVSCTSPTSCTFSTVAGLSIGDPLSVYVNSVATWGAAFVSNIVGNVVTLSAPLCHSYDGGNSCTTITGAPTPANGDPIRWNGLTITNVSLTRNIFAHYPEWSQFMDGDCGGKGYLEVKTGTNLIFNGNVFTGCTGPTVTVRNQAQDFPWATLNGLRFTNNLWVNSNRVFVCYLRDSSPTPKTQDVEWSNNLVLGALGNPDFFPGGEFSSSTGGGIDVRFIHNTVAWNKTAQPGFTLDTWHNWLSSPTQNGYNNQMDGLEIRDNIFGLGGNICFPSGVITDCWNNADVNHNVFVNSDNWTSDEINSWWRTAYPASPNDNSYIDNYGQVVFISPNGTLTLAPGVDYRLGPTSPYKNAGSDGSDIGYNHAQLVAALGFDPYTGSSPQSVMLSGNVTISGIVVIS